MENYTINLNYNPSGDFNMELNFQPLDLTSSGQEKYILIEGISGLSLLKNLEVDIEGTLNTRKIKIRGQISITGKPEKITELFDIIPGEDCKIELNPFFDYDIKVIFERIGSNDDGVLKINKLTWDGCWETEVRENFPIYVDGEVIFKVPNKYKVFSIDGYELVSRNDENLEVFYRISQNDGRSWSEWTRLTESNITNQKVDAIRFFQIEYKFSGQGEIADLNLIGEIINVTENYNKANLIGLRENCKNGVVGNTGINGGSGNLSMTADITEGIDNSLSWGNDQCDLDSLFKPYKLKESIALYDELSNQVSNIFGWNVEYYKVSPDENGIDKTIHEYTLYNVNQYNDVKILVPQNQFPNNQVAFNQWDMNLFESFEIQITKKEFKSKFGVDKRPSKEDFLYICELSRMYIVDHAQAIRDFANASVYYKLILKKYNQKADVQAESNEIQSRIDSLTANSTLEDLFGTDMKSDKDKVANKKQQDTLTNDRTREVITAPVTKELIENSSLIVSKYSYDLSKVDPLKEAIKYKDGDSYLQKGENRSFYCWFKPLEYPSDVPHYEIINNYDSDNNKGFKVGFIDDEITATINDKEYVLPVELDESVWFCYIININQRQEVVSQFLYKRKTENNYAAARLDTTELHLISSNELPHIPIEYEFDQINLKIHASPMKITNLRLFNDIIPETEFTKILNQNIIRDSDYIIMADNANEKIILPRYPYN